MSRVVVIGAGIAGLTAGFSLATGATGPEVDVTVLEASERVGGKIRSEPFAGLELDTGPDAFLARVPAAAELCRAVGLGPDLVAPATGAAYLWSGGRLRRLPAGLVLGVPTDLVALARSRLLSVPGMARVALDLVLPSTPIGRDASVGDLLRARLGAEAHLHLADPLLGAINAGRTEELSLAVTAPQLAAAASSRSLIRGLRATLRATRRATGPAGAGPVFLTVRGGLDRLTAALAAAIAARAGSEIRLGAAATALSRTAAGWTVTTASGAVVVADAVVVAVPAPAAAALLTGPSPEAARQLARITYASVVLLTLAYRAEDVGHPLDGSGFLVPRVEGRLMTACSWAGSKWPHLATPGQVVVRVSAGRAGDERALALEDGPLVERLHGELAAALNLAGRPMQARVHRWIDAFPQFAPGHLDRVAAMEAALAGDAPGVTLAGAAYRGVGLATCIVGGQAAARAVQAGLGSQPDRVMTR